MQFLEGTGNLLLGAASEENYTKANRWPASHLCTFFELNKLLSSRRPAHENYIVSWMSSWSAIGTTDWENCAIFWGDMDGHLVSIWHVYAISSVTIACKVSSLYAIFEGSHSPGGCQVRLSRLLA